MSKKQKQHRSYTAEFRRDAVKLIIEQGYTYPEAADRLGIPFHTLKNWVKHFRAEGTLPPASELNQDSEELKRLRKENQRLQMEVAILKKAAAYFAKESL